MKKNNNTNKSLGILDVILVVLIILKVTNLIDWSWLWILCPVWFPVILVLLIFTIDLIVKKVRKK